MSFLTAKCVCTTSPHPLIELERRISFPSKCVLQLLLPSLFLLPGSPRLSRVFRLFLDFRATFQSASLCSLRTFVSHRCNIMFFICVGLFPLFPGKDIGVDFRELYCNL